MRCLIVVILLLFVGIKSYSQEIDHWESVITSNNSSKYLIGNNAPDTNWKSIAFDDTSWSEGKASIGYGDGDDSTNINIQDVCLSVYVRIEFTIVDISNIKKAIFNMDYDDAFVAYLNGTEIARSNIGSVGSEPTYNIRASSDHEALLYQGGTPETFNLSDDIISSVLQQGTNVLAIQAHNATIGSSDMTCMPFISLGITDASNNYQNTPGWFIAPVENFSSSKLPILIFNTEGGVDIQDEPKVKADLKIAYNENGDLNYVDGPYHESSGPIGIEIRGNVTQTFPKKPYLFETRDSLGNNRNVKILGLPSENDWILRACYLDKTLMRNAIACQMSRSMGHYASRFVFCEVILNGSYDGVYLLMEKIKQDNNRMNIDKMHPWTTDSDSLKGGYIYEVSQSESDMGKRRNLKYPNPDWANQAQYDYIINYDDQFRNIMDQTYYNDPKTGYPAWIDVQSFIDEIIVQEACKNSDAYGWSSYFHKRRHQKLAAGPVWDFDQALCNSTFNDGSNTNEWNITKAELYEGVPNWWNTLFNDPTFKYLFKKRWFELRSSVLHTDTLMSKIDGYAQLLEGAQQRNFTRWPILGVELWRSLPGWSERNTYQKEVDYMKTWFNNHLSWIDQQLTAVQDITIPIPNLVISEIMYSAYNGPEKEYIKVKNAGSTFIDLTGVFFSDGIEYSFNIGEIIQPGETMIIASDTVAYRTMYGTEADDKFIGQLDNKGEIIELQNSYGVTIDYVNYNDTLPWPVSDLNHPGAIKVIDLNVDNNLASNWEFVENNIEVPNLVISEIMYAPDEGADYEFIEIVNKENDDVDLTNVFLSDAIDYTFPEGYIIKSGESIVVASNNLRFNSKYGYTVLGDFTGKLDNAGERIVIQNLEGGIIDVVEYNNNLTWPIIDPTYPTSIELSDLMADNANGENWVSSENNYGTPAHEFSTGYMLLTLRNDIKIFPNPAKDVINIQLNDQINENMRVEIYDMLGVQQITTSKLFIENIITLDVGSLKIGSYILKITTQNSSITEKIIIKR